MTRFALPEEKRKQMAQLINAESKRLGRMIEVFLNVERLSAGQIELRRERFAAAALVEACLERARPLAERKQIKITVEPLGDGIEITGDRELMEYAFYNLVTNAIKYSPQRTEVTVKGGRQDGNIRLAVKDQGIGMDQKEIRQIFQKFYRTRRAEQTGEAGTGIGLSIVEQIIRHHGGTIEVTSSPGQGSCFTLVLPEMPAAVAEHS
jgi:two-component system sensor histidine kinase SenX3